MLLSSCATNPLTAQHWEPTEILWENQLARPVSCKAWNTESFVLQIQTIDGKITYLSQRSGSPGKFPHPESGEFVRDRQPPEVVFEPEAVSYPLGHFGLSFLSLGFSY